jgi:acetolactate synthase-1/2/3 large subunit
MTDITGAEALARLIAASGMTHVFFVDAVARRMLIELEPLGVRRVLAHSEKAAAYMADAYARVAKRPALALAQSVGAANLAAGLQDAYLGRSPVVALTGRKPPSHQRRNAYQEVAHAPLFAPVTGFSERLDDIADLPRLFRQALREAAATARPAHLDLLGLQGDRIESWTIDDALVTASPVALPAHRPRPDPAAIDAAAKRLLGAARVAIVAGDGAALSGCGAELLALAEALAAPVAFALGAKSLIPDRHPHALGVVGTYSAPYANRVAHEADCVLFVGCDTGDQVTHDWRIPRLATPAVQIDVDAAELGRSFPDTVGVLGDPREALAALLARIGKPARDRAFLDFAVEARDAWRRSVAATRASDAAPIRVERLCAELERWLSRDAILVADTGYSGIWTGTMIDLAPPQTYLRAAGSLGWAFPASLGAKCAAPDREVVCFCGDGAFYYHLPELETARRRKLKVTVVINNNSAFGQGLINVRRLQGNRPGNPDEIIRFGPTDFAAIARAFGVEGIRVERADAIAPALAAARAAPGPVVVDVVTDAEPRAPEPWAPA